MKYISISVHILIVAAVAWRWESANEQLRTYLFYAIFIAFAVQGSYLSYKNDKLKALLEQKDD